MGQVGQSVTKKNILPDTHKDFVWTSCGHSTLISPLAAKMHSFSFESLKLGTIAVCLLEIVAALSRLFFWSQNTPTSKVLIY